MSQVEARLQALGHSVPDVAKPAANYVPFVVVGNLIYVSGQIPMKEGKLPFLGKVGDGVEVETAQQAAQLCGLNIIGAVKGAIGNLDAVTQVVKLGGFVNSTPDFANQPEVINGASDLMVAAFGAEVGAHARAAVSAGALPRNVTVEVDAVVAFDPAKV